MIKAKLPIELKLNSSDDLIRIGRDIDGGYLVSIKDVTNTEILISMGICDDWSFEQEFLRYAEVPIIAYDASVGFNVFFSKFLLACLRFYKPDLIFKSLGTLISYLIFFRKNKVHIQKFVSCKVRENASHNSLYTTIEEIFKKTKSNKIFLKIDIEGSEYRILESILKNQNRISGLIIEFHEADLNIDLIKKFISTTNLNLVHIHGNNTGLIIKGDQFPTSLEITLSKYSTPSKKFTSPHPLDKPNDPKIKDISLIFE